MIKSSRLNNENIFFYSLLFILAILLSIFNFDIPYIYDDVDQIITNPTIKKLPDFYSIIFEKQLRMMRVWQNITFAIDWWISGPKTWSFHLTNNLLHLLNTLLFFKIFSSLFPKYKNVIKISCLFFFFHPLQLQPVSYIMGRIDLLRTFFMLICFNFYLNDKKIITYFFLCISLLAKELNAITPLIFIGFDIIIKKANWKNFNYKKHLFYLSHIFWYYPISLVWRDTISQHGDTFGFNLYPFIEHTSVQFGFITFYLKLFFNPNEMAIFHEYNSFIGNNTFEITLGLLIIVISLYLTYFFYKRDKRMYLFILFMFYFSYLPTNSFLQFINPFAEYRLYLSLFFLIFSIVIIFEKFLTKKLYKIPLYIFSFVYLSIFHYYFINDWKNPIRVWKLADENYPKSISILINLSYYLYLKNEIDESRKYLLKAKKVHDAQKNNIPYLTFLINKNLAANHLAKEEYKDAFEYQDYIMRNCYQCRTDYQYLFDYMLTTSRIKNITEFNRAFFQYKTFYGDYFKTEVFLRKNFEKWEKVHKELNKVK